MTDYYYYYFGNQRWSPLKCRSIFIISFGYLAPMHHLHSSLNYLLCSVTYNGWPSIWMVTRRKGSFGSRFGYWVASTGAGIQFYGRLYFSVFDRWVPGLYMIGYGKGKIILKFPPFFWLNEENQEQENSKHQMKTKTVLFLFSFDFEFPALDFPHSIWRKAGISK